MLKGMYRWRYYIIMCLYRGLSMTEFAVDNILIRVGNRSILKSRRTASSIEVHPPLPLRLGIYTANSDKLVKRWKKNRRVA